MTEKEVVCERCGRTWNGIPSIPHHRCNALLKSAAITLGIPFPFLPGTARIASKLIAGKPLGPGDWLHIAILKWVNKGPTRKCGCQDRINQMNAWGAVGCRERLDEIVGWLAGEAEKHGWWQYAVAVPGSLYFIKRMVLSAIKKAETNARQLQPLALPVP